MIVLNWVLFQRCYNCAPCLEFDYYWGDPGRFHHHHMMLFHILQRKHFHQLLKSAWSINLQVGSRLLPWPPLYEDFWHCEFQTFIKVQIRFLQMMQKIIVSANIQDQVREAFTGFEREVNIRGCPWVSLLTRWTFLSAQKVSRLASMHIL